MDDSICATLYALPITDTSNILNINKTNAINNCVVTILNYGSACENEKKIIDELFDNKNIYNNYNKIIEKIQQILFKNCSILLREKTCQGNGIWVDSNNCSHYDNINLNIGNIRKHVVEKYNMNISYAFICNNNNNNNNIL